MTEIVNLSERLLETDPLEHQEPKFFGSMLADILRIKQILDPVFPIDLDIWQACFRHYKNPGEEIRWWLFFSEEYRKNCEGKSLRECAQIFEHMLTSTFNR